MHLILPGNTLTVKDMNCRLNGPNPSDSYSINPEVLHSLPKFHHNFFPKGGGHPTPQGLSKISVHMFSMYSSELPVMSLGFIMFSVGVGCLTPLG